MAIVLSAAWPATVKWSCGGSVRVCMQYLSEKTRSLLWGLFYAFAFRSFMCAMKSRLYRAHAAAAAAVHAAAVGSKATSEPLCQSIHKHSWNMHATLFHARNRQHRMVNVVRVIGKTCEFMYPRHCHCKRLLYCSFAIFTDTLTIYICNEFSIKLIAMLPYTCIPLRAKIACHCCGTARWISPGFTTAHWERVRLIHYTCTPKPSTHTHTHVNTQDTHQRVYA